MSEDLIESPPKPPQETIWQQPGFRQRFIVVCIALSGVFSAMPYFFNFIQQRHGTLLNDWVLNALPPINFSIPIFGILYGLILWLVFRAYQDPRIFLNYATGYVLLTLCRAITIFSFPLEPPTQLVDLVDPITGVFYGGQPITRDLFFSGHTSSVFLVYLVLYTPKERFLSLAGTLCLAVMLLFQHIHYTIDVVVAFPATYLLFWLSKRWTKV